MYFLSTRLLRQKGLRSHLSMVYSEKIFKFARGFSNVYDDPQPYDHTSFSGSSDSPKSFSSLQEFCDYLNSHDESERNN